MQFVSNHRVFYNRAVTDLEAVIIAPYALQNMMSRLVVPSFFAGIVKHIYPPFLDAERGVSLSLITYIAVTYLTYPPNVGVNDYDTFLSYLSQWMHDHYNMSEHYDMSWQGLRRLIEIVLDDLIGAENASINNNWLFPSDVICNDDFLARAIAHEHNLLNQKTRKERRLPKILQTYQGILEKRLDEPRPEYIDQKQNPITSDRLQTYWQYKSIVTAQNPKDVRLDLAALRNYQSYGNFLPEDTVNLSVEHVRRQHQDEMMPQRVFLGDVDGINRKGRLTTALKWQYALAASGEDVTIMNDNQPQIIKSGAAFLMDRYFSNNLHYLQHITKRTQNVYMTILLMIDAAHGGYQKLAHGRNRISYAREVGAYLLQDMYLTLQSLPKLRVDVLAAFYNEKSILRKIPIIINNGSGTPLKTKHDLFSHEMPYWLNQQKNYASPAQFFESSIPFSGSGKRTIDYQIMEIVEDMRFDYSLEQQGVQGSNELQAITSADLLVVLDFPSRSISERKIQQYYNKRQHILGLGNIVQLWLCNIDSQDNNNINLEMIAPYQSVILRETMNNLRVATPQELRPNFLKVMMGDLQAASGG